MQQAHQKRKKTALTWLRITVAALAVLLIALAIALIVDVVGMKVTYTLEAGEPLPPATTLCRKNGVRYEDGVESMDFSKPGEYEFYALDGNRKIKIRLTVSDTLPPKGELLALRVHQGGKLPDALDFFANVTDASPYYAKFRNAIDPSELGSYDVELELYDEYGNSKKYKTVMEVIIDTEPPVFVKLPKNVVFGLYDTIAYRSLVEVQDNCFGVDLQVDSSSVNVEVEGSYTVTYTAVDSAGNKTSATMEITIVKELVTQEQLNARIEQIASTFTYQKVKMKDIKDRATLCCAIYSYVNSPNALSGSDARIRFEDTFSYTRHGDWRKEAYEALTDSNPKGDCFTYYAVAKAFFAYFGIENLDIERTAGVRTDGTHFWSMVNLGTEKAPQWYYFDATRLRTPHPTGSGCLFTEAQLQAYNAINSNFLTFDHTGYPATAEAPINMNFAW